MLKRSQERNVLLLARPICIQQAAQADVNGQVSSFVYDTNDQLEEETLPNGTMNTYKYDEVGNRTASEVNGKKSWKIVRKDVLANTITTIIGLAVGFHGIYTLARMLKTYTKAKVVQLKLVTYITKMGIYRNLAVTIASTLVNSIINIAGSSIGGVAVWVLSRYFKTVTKYAKKYVYWGSKVKVEYLDFGKRR